MYCPLGIRSISANVRGQIGVGMFRIVFTSRLYDGIGPAEVASIHAAAIARNRETGITGAWLIRGKDCLSALEGPPLAVRETTERIWDDRRHGDFKLEHMSACERRLFADWPLEQLTPADFEAKPDLFVHQGLSWLGDCVGGLESFLQHGLSDANDHAIH